jgi:signal transduction histidine kinase
VLDVGLAVASAVECALQGVGFADQAALPVPLGVLFGLAVGSVLVLRRRWPIAVVLVSIATTPAEMGFLMGLVGLYTLAASDVPRRITATLAGMALSATFIVTFVRVRQDVEAGDYSTPYVPLMAVFMSLGLTAPPVLLGLYIGARRRLMESLRERADSLEQELSLLADRAEQRAQWARQEERTRIAREMHDVVAHRVSLMVVHAAALQAVALKDPQKAVKNAALVGDMGRQALTELREMLGVLRSGESRVRAQADAPPLAAVGAAAAAAAAAAAEDGPCIADIEMLVGQSRQAGMVVELAVQGDVRAYPPEVEQTAYRVIQEALTNVHKHAAGAKAGASRRGGRDAGGERSPGRGGWRGGRRAAQRRQRSGGYAGAGDRAGRGLRLGADGRGGLPGVRGAARPGGGHRRLTSAPAARRVPGPPGPRGPGRALSPGRAGSAGRR